MAQATFWFASPFKEWIGRRTLTLSWEGQASLRQLFLRLAADYPRLRANLPHEGLRDETMNQMLAVILDGDFLSLDSIIPDGAKVDVLIPLAGGAAPAQGVRSLITNPTVDPGAGVSPIRHQVVRDVLSASAPRLDVASDRVLGI